MGDFSSMSVDYSMWRFTMRPPKKVSTLGKGTYLFLGSNTYYHWLIEELPVYLRAVKEFPSATTLVHALAPIYVFDSLNLLNINYKVIQKCIQVEELVFVSKSATLQPDSGDTDVLRETYLPWIENTSSAGSEVKIYISRLNQGRFPQNELAIQELFTDYGFEILDLVGRSFKDQIELFSRANVVAGTHGAGLSNIVWSGPNTSVIEIIDWRHPKCFEVLAQIGSQRYFGIQNSGNEWTIDLENLNSTIAFSLEKK
jgi:capsular polysaccharide biosynthesis protein